MTTRFTDVPCSGCVAELPDQDGPVPLVVVLHGDWGHGTRELARAWAKHALPQGLAVLALECPRELGCRGSYWQWDGDPAWVTAQVDALAARRPIDRERVSLVGWSGGASYIGLRTQAFDRTFAAIVHHGGGMLPREASCGAGEVGSAPVFFLVGSGNPLHDLAVRLREHYEQCGQEVVWRLLPRADHAGEWSALERHGDEIVSWLLTKRRGPRERRVIERPAVAELSEVAALRTLERPPPPVPPRACAFAPGEHIDVAALFVILLGILLLARRTRREVENS